MAILGLGVKKPNESQKKGPLEAHPRDRVDVLFAVARRLADRITELEVKISTLRRDVNATQRKVYRDEPEPELPLQKKRDPDDYRGLFGIS